MSGFIQEFQFYMSYPFVRYALIVGVLISLCSSLLGVTLVLKRFSFKQQKHYNNSLDSLFMLYLIYLFDNEVYL